MLSDNLLFTSGVLILTDLHADLLRFTVRVRTRPYSSVLLTLLSSFNVLRTLTV